MKKETKQTPGLFKERLRAEYQAAAEDEERNKLIQEWSVLDVEGLDPEEDW